MILVTGATGLVGGHLLFHLLTENTTVRAIRRKSSQLHGLELIFASYNADPKQYLDRIEWVTGDVTDKKSILEAMNGVSQVFHCAAVVSLGNGSDLLTDTNVSGTRNVVEAALQSQVQKFCFVSSIAACGKNTNGKPIDEQCEWTDAESRSVYARSKYFSEQEVWKGIRNGLNAVIVNPGVILGFSGNNSGSAELFYRVRKGLPFYTNGGSGYVDVKDVVKVMMLLMKSEISAERFILVAENCSNKDILSWIALGFGRMKPVLGLGKPVLLTVGYLSEIAGKVFGFKPLLDRGMARSALNREYYSSEKIKKALGLTFIPIEKTIQDVCRQMK